MLAYNSYKRSAGVVVQRRCRNRSSTAIWLICSPEPLVLQDVSFKVQGEHFAFHGISQAHRTNGAHER
jgi:hypothetical protein